MSWALSFIMISCKSAIDKHSYAGKDVSDPLRTDTSSWGVHFGTLFNKLWRNCSLG